MSIMRCDKHGAWDSDLVGQCPVCLSKSTNNAIPLETKEITGNWLCTKYSNGITVLVPPIIMETYDWDMDASQRMADSFKS